MVNGLLRKLVCFNLVVLLMACNYPSDKKSHPLGVASDCNASETTCHVSDSAINVSLAMGPGVKPLQPFPLSLEIEAGRLLVENVVVDFQMQGMDMGSNRYRLQQVQNRWQGTVILPVCSTERMDWHAVIEFTLDGEPFQAAFPFYSEAR